MYRIQKSQRILVTLLGSAVMVYLSVSLACAEEGAGEGSAESGKQAIYVVDMERVISESIAGKAARNTMEQEVKKSEKKLQLLKSEIDRIKAEAAKQVALLSDEAIDERKDAIAKRERDFQRSINDSREELKKKNDSEMGKVVKHIDEAIDTLAQSGRYPIIIEKDPRYVVYSNKRFDITDVVVKAVDEKSTG